MNRSTVSSALVAAGTILAAAGCTKDPLAALRAGPARLIVSSKTLTVNVKDSVAVTATVVDEQGNPLPDPASATSATPAVVTVSTASGAPLPQSKFFIKGQSFGRGTVNVTVGSITVPITVISYPASVRITGGVDSLNSGTTLTLTATPLSAVNDAVSVPPDSIRWSSDETPVAVVTTPGEQSTVTAKAPGVANIIVTLPGGASTQLPLRIVPAPYSGTLSASSGSASNIITLTTSGAPFDADTRVSVGGVNAWISGTPTATSLSFAVPVFTTTGPRELSVINIGPDQIAQRTTFTISATTMDDSYEATNDDPATAPTITASGDYFLIQHGNCTDTGNGFGEGGAGTDCDDFFRMTNTGGASKSVTIVYDWNEGDADPDLYVTDVTFTNLVAGSFTAHPERVTFTLGAGVTVLVWLNLYEDGGIPGVLGRMRVTGL